MVLAGLVKLGNFTNDFAFLNVFLEDYFHSHKTHKIFSLVKQSSGGAL